jgi:hypothetical protein
MHQKVKRASSLLASRKSCTPGADCIPIIKRHGFFSVFVEMSFGPRWPIERLQGHDRHHRVTLLGEAMCAILILFDPPTRASSGDDAQAFGGRGESQLPGSRAVRTADAADALGLREFRFGVPLRSLELDALRPSMSYGDGRRSCVPPAMTPPPLGYLSRLCCPCRGDDHRLPGASLSLDLGGSFHRLRKEQIAIDVCTRKMQP